jgi:two-component system, chemotaxis family, sensor kinase CheA
VAIDFNDEIVQDFLIESGEILEALGEQLVEMEQRADDRDLLNAVFRGFHTIKGGAGFLNLDALVEVCHRAEDVFNALRNGERAVDTHLMDVMFRVLDVVNTMFNQMRAHQEPTHADAELLHKLESLLKPGASTAPPVAANPKRDAAPPPTEQNIEEQAFDALLDALEGKPKTNDGAKAGGEEKKFTHKIIESPTPSNDGASGDVITEDEFEALLDQLHGKGRAPAPGGDAPAHAGAESPEINFDNRGDSISENEFEALLDKLHGKGKGPSGGTDIPVAPARPAPKASPAVKPTPAAPSSAVAVKTETAPTKATTKGAAPGRAERPDDDDDHNAAVPGTPKGDTTVRVDTARLDDIMNLVGELVLVRNRLTTLRTLFNNEQVSKAVTDLELVTSDLQAAVMKTRMQPIKKVFGRFPRVVRDLARSLKKEVKLVLQGEETDLDKNLVEGLADPLIHLVRNAVDHGVESPEERMRKGKPAEGTIILGAEQEGDHILLTIQDDGGGIDPDVLRRKAVEKGIMDTEAAARLDGRDVFNIIFLPGFSTKAEISDISGRGVGMDVVKTRITQLNGSIEIDSDIGVGTTISIKVPLTLAILPTLMVTLKQRKFALPMGIVREIFELKSRKTNVVDGQLCVMVRDKAMPVFFLDRWLQFGRAALGDIGKHHTEGQVVSVTMGNMTVGFVVDQVLGLEEVVIKPLGAVLQGMPGLAGSTITGDGRIALIIDVPSLMKQYGGIM